MQSRALTLLQKAAVIGLLGEPSDTLPVTVLPLRYWRGWLTVSRRLKATSPNPNPTAFCEARESVCDAVNVHERGERPGHSVAVCKQGCERENNP